MIAKPVPTEVPEGDGIHTDLEAQMRRMLRTT